MAFQGCAGIPSSLPNSGNSGGGTTPVTQPVSAPPTAQVLTSRNDNNRTGLNANETTLTPANVNVEQFGKKFTFATDGYAVAQPLYLANANISGAKNVVFVATEHDSVYAFDADGGSTAPLWHVSFLGPNITTVTQAEVGSTIYPEIGITSTPVIDSGSGTIYVESLTKENGAYLQRLHALDVTNGDEKFGGPVKIEGSNGGRMFDPGVELQRPGLLLSNGKIYVAFGSHGDNGPYHGWIFSYDAKSLQQTAVWCVTPTGSAGAIWMGGDGLAADGDANVYAATANGAFNAASGGKNYSDSVLKVSADLSSVKDFFTPFDQQDMAAHDYDVGTGGVLLVPDQSSGPAHLLIATNKSGNIYVINRDDMGHLAGNGNTNIVQYIAGAIGSGVEDQNFSSPAYWNGNVYFAGSFDNLKAYKLSGGQLSLSSRSPNLFPAQGASPVVSANGDHDAIVWAIERTGIVHAYDATDVTKELWNNTQNAGRDKLTAPVAHFTVATVINGKVYVGTKKSLTVYGVL